MAPPRSEPLVVALVGTDHHPFDRLVGWVDAWAAGARDARVVVQHGSARPPAHAEGVRVLPPEELSDLLSRATAVVCHGGPGTIAAVRAAGLLPIVVARDPSLGEHVDDHQIRFVRAADRAGEIRAVASDAALAAALDEAVAEPGTVRIAPGSRDVAATVERFGRLVDDLVTPRPGVRVLFVAGWGRSGSTLLDRMLGQVSGVFSAGELRDIWQRGVVEDRLCGCGEAFHSCPVWRKVGETAFGGWDELDLPAVQRLRQRLDRPWSVPQLLASRVSPSWDRDVAAYRAILARLYPAIAEVTGAQVIVDSSKIATFALLLRGIPDLDLRTVHLVRDPRGVVHSWRKAVRRDDGGGRDAMIRYGVVPAAARYEDCADLLLFDAKPPRRDGVLPGALPGGNGLAFDWHLIAGRGWRLPWMLSGGLTASLLPEAVRISGATAVDVSSGVERRPGDKDPEKIREFLRIARDL